MSRIALVYGGSGTESEVSKVSAAAIKAALLDLKHEVVEIEMSNDFIADVLRVRPDLVYNAMHGKLGEDGTLPAILNFLKIPYTLSGMFASCVGMHKTASAVFFESVGLKYPAALSLSKNQLLSGEFYEVAKAKGIDKFIIKPEDGGSTVDTIILNQGSQFYFNEQFFKSNTSNFLLQEYISGADIFVGVVKDIALTPIEVVPSSGFYDYESKYSQGKAVHNLPAKISETSLLAVKEAALKAHAILGCKTVSRTDFRVRKEGDGTETVFILEINTHPGFTPLSLLPEAAEHDGISFKELVKIIVEDASFEE